MESNSRILTLLKQAKEVEKRRAINNADNDIFVFPPQKETENDRVFEQRVKLFRQANAHKIEANNNCSLCAVAPFYGVNVTELRKQLEAENKKEGEEEDEEYYRPDRYIESFFVRYYNPDAVHNLALQPKDQMAGMNKALQKKGINPVQKIKFDSKGGKTVEDLKENLKDIKDNQGIICFWYCMTEGVSHYLYGQKVDGKLQFIDFQLDKGEGDYPGICDFPTFYSFSKDKMISMDELIKKKSKVEATFLVYDQIAPPPIQERIELFRKQQIQKLQDEEPRPRSKRLGPDEMEDLLKNFENYLKQSAGIDSSEHDSEHGSEHGSKLQ
ncbi:hypothetical protein [Legionella cardiaca]|uniref:Peptidase C58 YopT-type domain-containing protein n=1 Tax=Legionella cardiaca TaxID=1071983 RepID=A0ABY8AS44_9GAMM|nr:hypothetical protein [Legionella cardiaca]WED43502.1 hypothetical protein PXX05_01650 [Legionella cardiaca]